MGSGGSALVVDSGKKTNRFIHVISWPQGGRHAGVAALIAWAVLDCLCMHAADRARMCSGIFQVFPLHAQSREPDKSQACTGVVLQLYVGAFVHMAG